MSDPVRRDPSHPEPGAFLQAYKPYLILFGMAAGGVALLVVVGGIALAIFMKAGWVLVPLACAIWTVLPLRGLRELEDGAGFFEGASPAGGGSGRPVAERGRTGAGPGGTGVGRGGTDIGPATEGTGGNEGAEDASTSTAPGDATGATSAGQGPSAGGPGAGVLPDQDMARRRAVWNVVRQRAVNALLITFAAWAALILLHLI